MPVIERVHHQDVDVRAHEDQVLREGVEHLPGIEVQERGDEVEAIDRDKRNQNQTGNSSLAAEEAIGELLTRGKRDLILDRLGAEGTVDKIDGED